MSMYTIAALVGNPTLDEQEILDEMRADARCAYVPAGGGLPDELSREMAEAFGHDEPPTDEQMDRDYAARRCDEAELAARYPGMAGLSDEALIGIVADDTGAVALMDDGDEVTAVAAILLRRRLDDAAARRTA